MPRKKRGGGKPSKPAKRTLWTAPAREPVAPRAGARRLATDSGKSNKPAKRTLWTPACNGVTVPGFGGPIPKGQVEFSINEPRAMSANGWTADELRQHGLEVVAGKVKCRFGCAGTSSNVPGISHHHYTCQFWQSPEGITKTPF